MNFEQNMPKINCDLTSIYDNLVLFVEMLKEKRKCIQVLSKYIYGVRNV